MGYEFKLPDLGEGLTEGEVARWLVVEGQEIAEDDPLVEIQTDKATVEVPSPAAGVVTRIHVREGEVVPVGTVLVAIGGDAEPAPSEPDVSTGQTPAVVSNPPVREPGRHRSSGRSPLSSESTWTPSQGPARRGGSPKRTFAPPQVTQAPTREGRSRCAEFAA